MKKGYIKALHELNRVGNAWKVGKVYGYALLDKEMQPIQTITDITKKEMFERCAECGWNIIGYISL